jgi:hypothetical protein
MNKKIILFWLTFLLMIGSCSNSKNQQSSIKDQTREANKYENFKFEYNDFEVFYDKFISDSIFQISRVKFPIKGVYADYEGEIEWTKEKWPFMKWDVREEIKKTQDSISISQSKDRFFFGSYCLDCGFSFEMTFDKIENEWFLTYRQENNY